MFLLRSLLRIPMKINHFHIYAILLIKKSLMPNHFQIMRDACKHFRNISPMIFINASWDDCFSNVKALCKIDLVLFKIII